MSWTLHEKFTCDISSWIRRESPYLRVSMFYSVKLIYIYIYIYIYIVITIAVYWLLMKLPIELFCHLIRYKIVLIILPLRRLSSTHPTSWKNLNFNWLVSITWIWLEIIIREKPTIINHTVHILPRVLHSIMAFVYFKEYN